MTDRLTEADLARMRAEHADNEGECATCFEWDKDENKGWGGAAFPVPWPCDVARLLAHFAPGPVPHLAGVAYGLMGPSVAEELPR